MLRRDDTCAACGAPLAAGVRATWDAADRTVTCLAHTDSARESRPGPGLDPVATGVAGGAAQRVYQQRHDARIRRIRQHHPRTWKLRLILGDDPWSTKVWAQGAAGERAVAGRLDRLEHGLLLHDRRLRRPDGRLSAANVDHIAVVPSGVWVIDAKTHRGRLEVRRTGGLLTPRVEQLRIGGRDRSALLAGLRAQLDGVRAALADTAPDVDVRGALCFHGTELPWIDEDIEGIPLRGLRGAVELLRQRGPLDEARRDLIHRHLASVFPPA